ncbi:MAG: nuclear transport factor 2 family protein [Gemmatimonadota bacterium]|nr:MAG: nuclear transport factor 2 family protein [Gemmatimonadota bacterium]
MNLLQRAIRISAVLLCGLIIYTQTAQSQEEEVRAAMMASLAAWNEGDVTAFGAFFSTETRGFNLDGGILIRGFNAAALEAALDAGFAIAVEPREIDVKVYGNAAVGVAYLDGSITLPGGTVREGTWRYSETRVKDGDTWKVVQYHISAMTVGAPPSP